MERKSKIEQILIRFEDCQFQSNEQLSASLYYAYCSLPIYDSSTDELVVKTATSINFKSIKQDSWEIDLADNIANIFRCVVSLKEVIDERKSSNKKKVYTFVFVGVENDPEIASHIYNKLYSTMIYKCKSTLKKSIDRVFSKKSSTFAIGTSCISKVKGLPLQANNELKSLVEDISDLSACLRTNEFSDIITKHFLSEQRTLIS